MKKIFAFFSCLLMALCAGCSSNGQTIRFGAAQVGGVYSLFANAYSQIVTDNNEDYEVNVRSTAGSAANLRLLSDNYLQMGIAQADIIDDAYNGKGEFEKKPLKGYSAVAALYDEACQIVVRADSDIYSVDDLLDKTVCIGEEESGTERNAKDILKIYGLSDDLVDCVNYNYAEAADAIVNNEIDAWFFTAGVKTTAIEEVTRNCDIRLLSIDDNHAKKLIASCGAYSRYTISAGTYKGQEADTDTLCVKSILLASDDLDSKTVEELTALLFENDQSIQYALPLDLKLDETSATESVSIPFHKGAAAYYEKNGITVED